LRRRILVAPSGRDGKRRAGERQASLGSGLPRSILAGTVLLLASLCAAAALAQEGTGSATPAQDVSGIWLTDRGQSQVRIAPCGTARCGTIIWTVAQARDANNPDPGRRGDNLVGLRILQDARRTGDSWTGSLYNPLDGRTYTGRMRRISAAELELSGCVLAGLICRSQTWTRVK
jgi:uncharacterized protein (DUF2147 family)